MEKGLLASAKLWQENSWSNFFNFKDRPFSVTERNWFFALLIVIGSGILFWLVRIFELNILQIRPGAAMVENASEISMRLLAIAHFIIAFLFIVTSKRMKINKSRLYFFALLVLGIGFCWGFSLLGAMKTPLGFILFYTYFMIHDFRDQIFIYKTNGDMPITGKPEALAKDLALIPVFIFVVFAATFMPAVIFEIGNGRQLAAQLRLLPKILEWTVLALPFLLLIILSLFIRHRFGQRYLGGVKGFIRTHRPLLVVFLGIYAVLIGGLIISGRAYSIVNLHVCIWYVFILYHLLKNHQPDPQTRPFTWRWMRTTPTGFNFLHIGLVVLLVFLCVIWVYNFQKDPQTGFWFIVSREIMPYWTIIHVTTSFLPKQ